jgi:S1-C subfamily serine protease
VVTALLLAVAVLVGLGIGHGVWRPSKVSITSNGSGSSGSSGSGSFPSFGSGGSSGSSGVSGSAPSFNTNPITKIADSGLVDIDTTLFDGEAAGTGIVLTSDGYILTNNHVISGADTIKVTDIGNGETYTGTVVGYDRTQDVALVKLEDASGLTTARIGNSNDVTVNESVVGIGNAGGTGGTPSAAPGRVTALGQSITAQDESNGTSENLTGLIETNADIQPGDSGGALVNTSGQVVGMDTAASSGFSIQDSGNQGFAIPINQALSIVKQIRSGTATAQIHIGPTAFLGVAISTDQGGPSGAALEQVVAGGPADQAGLQADDVITALGGSPVTSPSDLTNLMSKQRPGDNVQVTYLDPSGNTHQAVVHLGSGPAA